MVILFSEFVLRTMLMFVSSEDAGDLRTRGCELKASLSCVHGQQPPGARSSVSKSASSHWRSCRETNILKGRTLLNHCTAEATTCVIYTVDPAAWLHFILMSNRSIVMIIRCWISLYTEYLSGFGLPVRQHKPSEDIMRGSGKMWRECLTFTGIWSTCYNTIQFKSTTNNQPLKWLWSWMKTSWITITFMKVQLLY